MSTKPTPTLKPIPKTAIRIKHLRFNSKGLIIAKPTEAEDAISARETETEMSGYDIHLVLERQAFRFDRYDSGQFRITKWIPVSNIHSYEEWSDQPKIPDPS